MTPTTNHELLSAYIDMYPYRDDETGMDLHSQHNEFRGRLKSIQSKLIEPMEYEIGKEYLFRNSKGGGGIVAKFQGFWMPIGTSHYSLFDEIHPIEIPEPITSAISLLEATGEYTVTKK